MADRRTFIAGLAGFSLAGAATAAFPSAASCRADADGTVLDLGRHMDVAVGRAAATGDALIRAFDDLRYPEPPAALFYRSGDDEVSVLQPTCFRDGLAWYGDEVDLVARNTPKQAYERLDGSTGFRPDPEGVARRDEIVAAYAGWQADKAAARDAGGVTAAEAAHKASGEATRGLMSDLASAPALTLAGVAVKARAVGWAFGGVEGLSDEIGEEPDGTAETLALAIVRDLLRMAGEVTA